MPHKTYRPLILASFAAALALSACSSNGSPNPFAIFQDNRSEEEKLTARRERSWYVIADKTDARRVPGNRAQITTDPNLPGKLYRLEDAFLIRAAAETLNAGYDGFIIKYLDYEDSFFKWFNQPIETFPEAVEITAYEDFLIHSEEQTFFASRASRSQKRVQGIVAFVSSEDHPDGRYFAARETYDALIDGRKLKYR